MSSEQNTSVPEEPNGQQQKSVCENAPERLERSGIIVSAMTTLSRVLGLVREVVFAALFGDSAGADAFFVAFKIPNFLRRLFAEGAFSQAFVPVLSEYRKTRSREEIKSLLDHVSGTLTLVLVVVTILGVVGAPVLAGIFGFGYTDQVEKFALLIELLRITFPYILLISLTGLAGGILNTYGRFAVPAMTPVFLNFSLIACALLVSPLLQEPVMALAWGVLLAGGIQLMFQLPFLHHLHLIPRPRLSRGHEGVNKIVALMIPVMFSVSVSQINLLLDTVLATTQVDGSVSWLYYSDRLMELPLGMIGVAIATVILPSLSRTYAAESPDKFGLTLNWGLRCIVVVGVPATVSLFVLAEPMIITIYQRGAFDVSSVQPTVASLKAYSIGLVAFMAIKVLASAYFSRQDTRTPVRYGVVAMFSNMVFNLALIVPFAHVGLAAATTASAFINAGLLFRGLRKKKVFSLERGWLIFLLKVLLSACLMGLLLSWLMVDKQSWLDWGNFDRVWQLTLLCLAGAFVYFALMRLMGVKMADFIHA